MMGVLIVFGSFLWVHCELTHPSSSLCLTPGLCVTLSAWVLVTISSACSLVPRSGNSLMAAGTGLTALSPFPIPMPLKLSFCKQTLYFYLTLTNTLSQFILYKHESTPN